MLAAPVSSHAAFMLSASRSKLPRPIHESATAGSDAVVVPSGGTAAVGDTAAVADTAAARDTAAVGGGGGSATADCSVAGGWVAWGGGDWHAHKAAHNIHAAVRGTRSYSARHEEMGFVPPWRVVALIDNVFQHTSAGRYTATPPTADCSGDRLPVRLAYLALPNIPCCKSFTHKVRKRGDRHGDCHFANVLSNISTERPCPSNAQWVAPAITRVASGNPRPS